MNNLKWIAIQPLTGGMYLGAEEAIGHPAEFILSFEGLNKNFGNEQYLEEYLKKHNRNVMRYDIQEAMFDPKLLKTLEPTIKSYGEEVKLKYEDIDLVVAVPVCSGLSMVTSGSDETKEARNCNMKFITEYTIKKIQPKIYVFENAPTLMGSRGVALVEHFKNLAKECGYSVLFYKTDTNLHFNCQKRPRTFVVFFKHLSQNENEEPFVWEYSNNKISVSDFFKNIDNNLNGDEVKTGFHNKIILDYIKEKSPNNWRNDYAMCPTSVILKNNEMNNLIEYAKKYENGEKPIKYFTHILDKISQGKNYYGDDVCIHKERFPSIQFRSIPNCLHPFEDRICTVREYLTLMGHPEDFEWLTGNESNHLAKIGQNVPVKTAKFIVEQCLKSLEKWNEPRGNDFNSAFQDNIKQTKVW